MACMGPSKDYAYQRGDLAYREILRLLKKRYGVIDVVERPFLKLTQKNMNKKLDDLKRAIQEIIWESDCNNW